MLGKRGEISDRNTRKAVKEFQEDKSQWYYGVATISDIFLYVPSGIL